jgi:hypothetical protein
MRNTRLFVRLGFCLLLLALFRMDDSIVLAQGLVTQGTRRVMALTDAALFTKAPNPAAEGVTAVNPANSGPAGVSYFTDYSGGLALTEAYAPGESGPGAAYGAVTEPADALAPSSDGTGGSLLPVAGGLQTAASPLSRPSTSMANGFAPTASPGLAGAGAPSAGPDSALSAALDDANGESDSALAALVAADVPPAASERFSALSIADHDAFEGVEESQALSGPTVDTKPTETGREALAEIGAEAVLALKQSNGPEPDAPATPSLFSFAFDDVEDAAEPVAASIPEPAALLLFGAGLAGAVRRRIRRN